MQLIDTHAHLTDEKLASDLDSVITRAIAANVSAIVAVGTTAFTSEQTIDLTRKLDVVRPAVGIHPNYAAEASPGDWSTIERLAQNPSIVAIGETGLDRFRSDTPFPLQIDYFERHLALSRDQDLPVIIHCRDADSDVLEVLRRVSRSGPIRGVMHSFTGSAAVAAECVELGLYISFAGQLTFNNRKFDTLREVCRLVPDDRILVETDSPYLAPEPHRGQRNEPSYVQHTAGRLAECRGMTLETLADQTTANARTLFSRMT